MVKRARVDFMTPDLLAKQLTDDQSAQEDLTGKSLVNISDRKIVRVKRHNQETGQVTTEEGPKLGIFKLAGSLSTLPDEKENEKVEAKKSVAEEPKP